MATHRLSSKGHTAMFGLLPIVAVLAALALPPLPTLVFALALVVWGVTGLAAPTKFHEQTPSPDAGVNEGATPSAPEHAAAVATKAAATPTAAAAAAAAVRTQPTATRPHQPATPAEDACLDAESSSEAGVSEEATSVLTPSPSELADRRFEGWHPLVAAGGGRGFLSLGASTAGSEEGTDGESETDGEGWQDQFEELVQVRYVQLPRVPSTQAYDGHQASALWPQPFQPISLAAFPYHPQPLQPLY